MRKTLSDLFMYNIIRSNLWARYANVKVTWHFYVRLNIYNIYKSD